MGEIVALSTAFCWAITTVAFENSAKRIGSMNLNLLRLLMGLVFLCLYNMIVRGIVFPTDANLSIWLWLALSGVIGLVIGDLLLLEALCKIGARISMLIYASSPIFSGLFAWILMGDAVHGIEIIGMFVTFAGIILVMFKRDTKESTVKFAHPVAGVLMALGATIAQALGYVIGKIGMGDYDAFAATQIRIIASAVAFCVLFIFIKQFKSFFASFKDAKAMKSATIGSFFGPFLGISLSFIAVQRINPGVASTLMSITPVILIFYAVFIKKEKIVLREILGSAIAMGGIVIMLL